MSIRLLLSVLFELLECQQLNSYERAILNDLVEILTPFLEVTDATEGQYNVTGSFFKPCMHGLQVAFSSTRSLVFLQRKNEMLRRLFICVDP